MRGAIIGGLIGGAALIVMSLYKGEGGSITYMASYLAGGVAAGAMVGYLIGRKT